MAETTEEQRSNAPTLTYSQARNRADEVHARMEQIGELDNPTDEENAEFRQLGEEFDGLVAHMGRLERSAEMARVRSMHEGIGSGASKPVAMRFEPGATQASRSDYDRDAFLEPDSIEDCRFRNPWDLSDMRTFGRDKSQVAGELRARALSAVQKMQGCNDDIRQAATHILERFDDSEKGSPLAQLCLATSSPEYMRAWVKMARNAHHTLSPEEQRAVAHAESVRAMSLTDSAGGYLVPFQLDPTVIITSSGTYSDIRNIARIVVATGDVWNGVSSANVSWSWDAEAAEVSDDSTTFAQPSIPNYKAQGFVPISFEALQDEANVAQAVGELLAGGKMDLEGSGFITGSGTGQPTGIVTALAASSPTVVKNSATTDTFALADIYALQGALPARFRSRSAWLSNNLIYNKTRQFDTAGGNGLWAQLGEGRPAVLLGRPVAEAEAMDGVIDASQENYAMIYGDFSNFVITDRVGVTVEFIPNLFGSNRRPTGQRGWLAWYRTGSDSVNDNAFRMLDVT